MNNIVTMASNSFRLSDGYRACSNGGLFFGLPNTDPSVTANQINVFSQSTSGDLVSLTQPVSLNKAGQPINSTGTILTLVVDRHYSISVYDSYGVLQYNNPINLIDTAYAFESLRNLPVLVTGQLIYLNGYRAGSVLGAGYFIGRVGTATDDAGIIAAGSGFYWERVETSIITPQMFGAYADGTTADTTAFQNAIGSGRTVDVPAGKYVLDCNQISIPSNTKITFGRDSFITIQNSTGAAGAGNEASVFTISGTSTKPLTTVEIIGGNFTYANDGVVVVSIGSYCTNVFINGIICSGVRGVYTTDGSGTYAGTTVTSRSKNIWVRNCVGVASALVSNGSFIALNYIENSGTDKNLGYGYFNGILVYGGNPDTGVNGAVGNDRAVKHIRLCNDQMTATSTGIVVRMGEDIRIAGAEVNVVSISGSDRGILFEGCLRSQATGSYGKNFANGVLAFDWINDTVYFENCDSEVNGISAAVGALSNASASLANMNIGFNTCRFRANLSVSVLNQTGPVDNLRIHNCDFFNVQVSLGADGNGILRVSNNVFNFNIAPTNSWNAYGIFSALTLTGFSGSQGVAFINSNTFSTSASWSSLTYSCAIFVASTSTTQSTTIFINGGGTLSSGWTYDVLLANGGSNVNYTLNYSIRDFTFYNSAHFTIIAAAGYTQPKGTIAGTDSTGGYYPQSLTANTAYANTYYSVGQRFVSQTPTAGGFAAGVVTTAGTGTAAVVSNVDAISS